MKNHDCSIFISYAKPDQKRVLPFFDGLEKKGFNIWMDCRRLRPGQNWDFEISRALDKATFVLFFVSKLSFDRRGYIQRELKSALDKQQEKLVDDIYLIPVLLDDDVQVPDQLKHIEFILASDIQCLEKIADALNYQLERLGIERQKIQDKEQLYWRTYVKEEEWDGLPGYEVELQFIEFSSDRYSNVSEIGEYIRGVLLSNLFRRRADKLVPPSGLFNYGQDKFWRTNTYDAHCNEPVVVGNLISIQYNIDWYGAGGAHPNHQFQTYTFLLEPVALIPSLEYVFREPDIALNIVQTMIREQLYQVRIGEDEWEKLEPKHIEQGTQDWNDFESFLFRPDGIEVLFEPYQVAAYAYGPQSVKILYEQVTSLLRAEFISALKIQHLVR